MGEPVTLELRLSMARAMIGLWVAFGDMLHEYAHRCYDRARAWEKEVTNDN